MKRLLAVLGVAAGLLWLAASASSNETALTASQATRINQSAPALRTMKVGTRIRDLEISPVITASATTGTAFTINGITVTTGDVVKVYADSDILTTGKLLNLYAGSSYDTSVFSVADHGAVLVGSTSVPETVAGGTNMLYANAYQTTTALTGDLIAVRGNSRVGVASTSGKVIGGYFLAGNGGADDIGYNLNVMRGVYAGTISKAPSGASATIDVARAYEAIMDLDQGTSGHTMTVTDAYMFYGVYNAPTVGTYATITNGYGIYVKNEAVGGNGQALDAAFYATDASMSGGVHGWDYGIDFSGIGAASGNFGTADIRLANSETIDNTTNGIVTITGAVGFNVAGGTAAASTGVLGGAGTSTSAPQTIGSGSVTAFNFFTQSSSTTASHSVSGVRYTMMYGTSATAAAPSGDVIRGRAWLVGDASGGVALTGGSFSVELASTGATHSGLAAGSRGNIVYPDGVITGAGHHYGVMAEIFLSGAACDTTALAGVAPLNITVGGVAPTAATQVANMAAIEIDLPSNMVTSDATMVCTGGATDTCDAKLKIRINNTDYWIMLSTDDE